MLRNGNMEWVGLRLGAPCRGEAIKDEDQSSGEAPRKDQRAIAGKVACTAEMRRKQGGNPYRFRAPPKCSETYHVLGIPLHAELLQ